MDAETRAHFDNWLGKMFRPENAEIISAVLSHVAAEDIRFYCHEGWPRLLRDAEARFGNYTTWDGTTLDSYKIPED